MVFNAPYLENEHGNPTLFTFAAKVDLLVTARYSVNVSFKDLYRHFNVSVKLADSL